MTTVGCHGTVVREGRCVSHPRRDNLLQGIWMWSKHFVVRRPGTNEKMALLVLDTQVGPRLDVCRPWQLLVSLESLDVSGQGLYDHDTSEQLTTSIFGLSTLISSYLVFNVSLQIQEDNLKSLALFSEYARVALHANRADHSGDGAEETKQSQVEPSDDGHGEEDSSESARTYFTCLVRVRVSCALAANCAVGSVSNGGVLGA